MDTGQLMPAATSAGRPKGGHALAIRPGLNHDNLFSSPLSGAATLAFLDRSQAEPAEPRFAASVLPARPNDIGTWPEQACGGYS